MPLPLVGAPVITLEHMTDYLKEANPGRAEMGTIVRMYYDLGWKFDTLRADVALCQMILETGHGTSWESQAPRYNFAGVGVTGTIVKNDINHRPDTVRGNAWSYDPGRQAWVQGLVYWKLLWGIAGHLMHLHVWMSNIPPGLIDSYFDPRAVIAYQHRQANKIAPALTTKDLSGPLRWAEDPDYWQKIDNIYSTILNWRKK
jgi:hypothetical protein